jgi:hypothetical protein
MSTMRKHAVESIITLQKAQQCGQLVQGLIQKGDLEGLFELLVRSEDGFMESLLEDTLSQCYSFLCKQPPSLKQALLLQHMAESHLPALLQDE